MKLAVAAAEILPSRTMASSPSPPYKYSQQRADRRRTMAFLPILYLVVPDRYACSNVQKKLYQSVRPPSSFQSCETGLLVTGVLTGVRIEAGPFLAYNSVPCETADDFMSLQGLPYQVRLSSSYAHDMLATGQQLVAECGAVKSLYSDFGPMFKQIRYTSAELCVQQNSHMCYGSKSVSLSRIAGELTSNSSQLVTWS